MTAKDLNDRIMKRFPDIKPGVLAEIREEADAYTEEDLYTLWEYFGREYSNVGAPHWGVFSKMAFKLDLRTKNRGGSGQVYEYVCLKPIGGNPDMNGISDDEQAQRWCMKRFHIGETHCPQCATRDSSFWVLTKAGNFVHEPKFESPLSRVLRQYARPVVAHVKRKPGDGAIGDKLKAREAGTLKLAVSPEELHAIKTHAAEDLIRNDSVEATDADWIEQLTGVRPPVSATPAADDFDPEAL